MHFTRMSTYATKPVPIIERGEGAYIWDTSGRKYLDGLSGLFAVQVGHGRAELAEVAAAQASKLAYFPPVLPRIRCPPPICARVVARRLTWEA